MINFIKKIFKSKPTNNKEIDAEKLINTLKSDHQILINIYQDIHNTVESDNFPLVYQHVKKFIKEYNKHILLEDTRLYIALKDKYKEQKQILKTIEKIEKDMNAITKNIMFFERKYVNNLTKSNKETFLSDLNAIGNVLIERVELEEERLYTLL